MMIYDFITSELLGPNKKANTKNFNVTRDVC